MKVIGLGQSPRLIHREEMHYTNAVLHESLRISCVVYNSLLHRSNTEIPVGGYMIPKGAIIIPSLMNVHHDPKHFPNPGVFNPSRYLDDNNEFHPDEHVIPFALGKRYCLGQSLAEKSLFLFLTGILSKFDITPVPNESLPSYHLRDTPTATIVRAPPKFNIILTNRIEE